MSKLQASRFLRLGLLLCKLLNYLFTSLTVGGGVTDILESETIHEEKQCIYKESSFSSYRWELSSIFLNISISDSISSAQTLRMMPFVLFLLLIPTTPWVDILSDFQDNKCEIEKKELWEAWKSYRSDHDAIKGNVVFCQFLRRWLGWELFSSSRSFCNSYFSRTSFI